jgi:hypothetical protein
LGERTLVTSPLDTSATMALDLLQLGLGVAQSQHGRGGVHQHTTVVDALVGVVVGQFRSSDRGRIDLLISRMARTSCSQ